MNKRNSGKADFPCFEVQYEFERQGEKFASLFLQVISYDKLCSNMKIIISILFAFISASGHAFSCYDPQTIIQKPIQFDKKRIALTGNISLLIMALIPSR